MEFCLDLSYRRWVSAPDAETGVAFTLQTIAAADRAGLHSVWLSEDPDGWDAFAVLGAAARQTERIRLGPGVTSPSLRHPVLMAMSVTTLDWLSGGRAFLGLGRGQPEWYDRGLGMPVSRPLAALEETIQLLRQWWQPPHVAHGTGERFPVQSWALGFGPLQPAVPIYLAAIGPKAVALAARLADGLLTPDFISETYLEQTLLPALHAELCAHGRDPAQFPVFLRTAITITNDPEPVLAQRKRMFALLATLPGMDRGLVVPGYDVPALIAQLRRVMRTEEALARGSGFVTYRKLADFAAAERLIPTDFIAQLSYVGTVSEIRSRLARLAALGVTHVFLSALAEPDPAAYAELTAALQP